ncbi:hypothetical protein GCM10009665_55720 [Kitasatospora nipponensis]|uniref:Uncharacterized protein n=1 Tax=Kitasatospora nipponensis TaxID=258049 RepID=A0ABN1WP38_9ACTN
MTIPRTPQSVIPPLFAGLCDDAAIFPPGDLPLPQAVPAHLAHRTAWYADLVGPFLCPAGRVEALGDHLGAEPAEGSFEVGLIVPEGSAALEPALRAARADTRLRVVGVEVLADRDAPPAEGVRACREALDRLLPAYAPGAQAAIEVARGPELLDALDALEGSPYRAKFRTGGTVAEAFPGELELASFLYAAVWRKLSFKCTAGLHHAVRHDDEATGFAHHGFLNVLLATHAALEGAEHGELADLLREREGERLARRLRTLDERQSAAAREAFTAFGTCSIAEPLADLLALELVALP